MSRALAIGFSPALAAAAALVLLAFPGGATGATGPPGYGIVRPVSEAGLTKQQLGKELFAGNCSMCHGSLGQGISVRRPGRASGGILGMGPPLRGVGERAPDFYLRTGFMPLRSPTVQPSRSPVLFTEREIEALVAYVGSLGGGPPIPKPDPAAGSVSKGQSLFTEHCAGCHQGVARGGYVTGARVPALQSSTDTQIAEAVRIGPYLMPSFPTGQISTAELNDIIAYVDYTRHPDHPGGLPIGYLGPLPEGLVTLLVGLPLLLGACLLIGRRFSQ